MKQLLKTLLAPLGPSGDEGGIADAIEALIKDSADEIRRDAMGNLIAIKKGQGPRVMLAAHMDEIGFMVTGIEENGFLRVAAIGGIRANLSAAMHVRMRSGAPGVLYMETEPAPKSITPSELFIDVGASSAEQAKKIADIGDWAVYAPMVSDMGERVASPYMDNRAGCAVLVDTFLRIKNAPCEVVAVFTSQEEVGLRGATAAAYDINPDYGIALDVTPTGDVPKSPRQSVELGKGAAIKVMDRSVITHPRVRDWLTGAAQKGNIPYQLEVLSYGGTDAGAIHLTRGGVPSGAISIPCRYVHAPCEMVDMGDIKACADLLVQALQDAPQG